MTYDASGGHQPEDRGRRPRPTSPARPSGGLGSDPLEPARGVDARVDDTRSHAHDPDALAGDLGRQAHDDRCRRPPCSRRSRRTPRTRPDRSSRGDGDDDPSRSAVGPGHPPDCGTRTEQGADDIEPQDLLDPSARHSPRPGPADSRSRRSRRGRRAGRTPRQRRRRRCGPPSSRLTSRLDRDRPGSGRPAGRRRRRRRPLSHCDSPPRRPSPARLPAPLWPARCRGWHR